MGTIISKDTLWKGIIEDLAEEFIQYFFPDLIPSIDWTHPISALDKELEQLFPDNGSKKRHADKLLKITLKDGSENWVLIHAEAQGYNDSKFPERMFQTFYRLFDRYTKRITTLVIYTNKDKNYHFQEYCYQFMGTELTYTFKTFSLVDYPPVLLQKSENVFAIILEAAWYDLYHKQKTDEERLTEKFILARRLLAMGYTKRKLRRILDFIKYYVKLQQPEKFINFDQKLFKNKKPMGITEGILSEVKEKGIEQGTRNRTRN